MEIKEILSKAQELLETGERIGYIAESDSSYICYMSSGDIELDGGEEVIVIDKKSQVAKRDVFGGNLMDWPIPADEYYNSKIIYDAKNEDTKSDEEIDSMFNL